MKIFIVFFVFLICFIYVLTSYYKVKNQQYLNNSSKYFLGIIRFFLVCTVILLFINPTIEQKSNQILKPSIVIALDQSQSIKLNNSDQSLLSFQKILNNQFEHLEKDFNLIKFGFGEKINSNLNWSFTEFYTDFSNLFDYIYTLISSENIKGIVLLSDGIVNKGNNFFEIKPEIPVFTIGLGKKTDKIDLKIENIIFNDESYIGNKTEAEILVLLDNGKQKEKGELQVFSEEKLIYEKEFDIGLDNNSAILKIILPINKVGPNVFKVKVKLLKDELNIFNNSKEITINGNENKNKISIIYSNVHPDIYAYKSLILDKKNYEIEMLEFSKFIQNIKNIEIMSDLIVFFSVPNIKYDKKNDFEILLKFIKETKKNLMFFCGINTDFVWLANKNLGFELKSNYLQFEEIFGVINKDFNLFEISFNSQKLLEKLPPIYSSTLINNSLMTSFINKKINNLATSMSMAGFLNLYDKKIGLFIGEGIHIWKRWEFNLNENNNEISEIFQKMTQYLLTKKGNNTINLSLKNIYFENENISIKATLFNELNEKTNLPELNFKFFNTKNKELKYNYIFTQNENDYHLNLGVLDKGEYKFEVSAKIGTKIETKIGSFKVEEMLLEKININPDHSYLEHISEITSGEFLGNNIENLNKTINSKLNKTPEVKSNIIFSSLLDQKWLYLIIFILFLFELIMRKILGLY